MRNLKKWTSAKIFFEYCIDYLDASLGERVLPLYFKITTYIFWGYAPN